MILGAIAYLVLSKQSAMETVSLKNIDAIYAIQTIRELAKTVILEPDPITNSVVVKGDKDEVAEATRMLHLFDVRSIGVELDIHVRSIRFDWTQDARVTTPNNGSWTFAHEPTAVKFSLSPRVNEDGSSTITLSTLDRKGKPTKLNLRIKSEETARFALGGSQSWIEVIPPESKSDPKWLTEVDVRISKVGKWR